MTNTYLLQGESDPQEIISSVDYGIYASNFGGGQVDITNGNFVFSMSEAWLIEKGKLTDPIKGATLTGNGADALTKIVMVGNDLELDRGCGTCGKNGQQVPTGVACRHSALTDSPSAALLTDTADSGDCLQTTRHSDFGTTIRSQKIFSFCPLFHAPN